MASEWPTSVSEYIGGHLGRLSLGESVPGPVTWALHVDTLLVSWALAFIGFYWLAGVAKRARVKEPTKAQVACELLFGFFDKQVRDLFPHAPPIVAPMAITIFVWVLLMNSMDLPPVDLITSSSYLATGSVAHFKLLPTADLSLTAALALVAMGRPLDSADLVRLRWSQAGSSLERGVLLHRGSRPYLPLREPYPQTRCPSP